MRISDSSSVGCSSDQQAFTVYADMVWSLGIGLSGELIWSLRWSEVALLMPAYFILAGGVAVVRGWRLPALRPGGKGEALMLSGLFVLAVSRLSANNFSPFLYFQF